MHLTLVEVIQSLEKGIGKSALASCSRQMILMRAERQRGKLTSYYKLANTAAQQPSL